MRIRLDGKPLSAEQIGFLLETVGFRSVHDGMIANGYRLNKIRAPRKLPPNGRMSIRFTWTIREPHTHLTVRLVGSVEVSHI